MKNRNVLWASVLLLSSLSLSSQANTVDFTIGGGLPFFVVPEFSFASDDEKKRYFVNYKMGLDDGFSFGFEQGMDSKNKHALGVFVGALGVRDADMPCSYVKSDDAVENFGKALACSFAKIYDEETTNGVGLSYSYNFKGLNHSGMRIRFELGYGEGSNSHKKRVDGGVVVSYQF